MDEFKNYVEKLEDIELLSSNYEEKSAIFVGNIDGKKFILQYKPKLNSSIEFLKTITECEKIVDNNRFRKFISSFRKTDYDISTIYPALPEDINKFSSKEKKRVSESYDEYLKQKYPLIVKQDLTWIYNILDGISEQMDILYEDDDFVLLPDIKWDRKDMGSLYCLAIVKDRNLRSIRDLNNKHISLLENIYDNSLKTIKKIYGVDGNKLRAYFHYYPSFWHLHVHFNLINNRSRSAISDIAHPLLYVIRNIKLVSDYYQRATLDVIVNA